MVPRANEASAQKGDPGLLTACIRLPIVYGEVDVLICTSLPRASMLTRRYLQRDLLSIPSALAALENNRKTFL